MNPDQPAILKRLFVIIPVFVLVLIISMYIGISLGSTDSGLCAAFKTLFTKEKVDSLAQTIIWRIRFPRVLMAALVGATLSLGGLVFQALLRNPLAEPYILGISGGSAIGAIAGILMGFSRFPRHLSHGLHRQHCHTGPDPGHVIGPDHVETQCPVAVRCHGKFILLGGDHVSGVHDPGCKTS